MSSGEVASNGTKILLQDVREYEMMDNYPDLRAARDETSLRTFLLQGYDSQVWPWLAEGTPCNTQIQVNFHKILGVDMPTGLLSAAIWFKQSWNDPRLVWDPNDWNGIQHIYFKDEENNRGELWTPQVELWNGEEPSWFHLAPQQFRVNYTGGVTWSRNGKFVVACNLKGIGGFPYDRMTCMLEFGSWNYAISEVDLQTMRQGYTTGESSVIAGTNSPYQEYDIIKIEVRRRVYSERYPVILYRIHLNRQHVHYTAKIIVPQAILTCVGFGAFWLHPASGERMGLAITVPVANAVYDLIMYEQLPTSRNLVFVAIFGMGSFVFSMLTVIETILVMHLGYKSDANLFNPLKRYRTLKQEVEELADWARLIQYMEKRLNPALQRSGSLLKRIQSLKNVRLRRRRVMDTASSNLGYTNNKGQQSQSCSNSNPTRETEMVGMGKRVLRPQDSCIVHQGSQAVVNSSVQQYQQQQQQQSQLQIIDSRGGNEGQEEEEQYESASEMDDWEPPSFQQENENNLKDQNSPFENTEPQQIIVGDTVFHRTAEEAQKFVDRLLKMEIPSKGSPQLQRAARRALRRHGYAKLEHRLLGILGHEDIVAALRRIDPRSYRDAVASEYNLRWQAIGRLIDFFSQWLFVLGYLLFCFITYTVVMIDARKPPDKNWD
eukprot:TRINITY_DN4213_c0_g1_i6.p1 TRINITY_DN4213_c0_g1~~TRINITY_DN4213_c0_g1_i6.p1  ORF type:complete len:759 (-),score=91.72 TRINITY_DN4213_c0_g1_i6:690-2672(-)